MQNPNNLLVTERALVLARETYTATRSFPSDERFGLTAQMRRAAVSIGSHIAEGCGRNGDKELTRFLYFSLGSASELEFQLRLAVELEYLTEGSAEPVRARVVELKRMLSRLIVKLSSKPW